MLDLGIAAVAWSKTWRPLNLIGFVATFVVATAWGVLKYRPEDFAISQAFLIAFFLLFVVILVLPAAGAARAATPAARRAARDAWVNSSLLFGLPTVVFALQYGLVRDTPFGAALSALAMAASTSLLATWMKKRPELGLTFDASLAIAHRLPDARHPVRARRAQHRRRLDARGRGPGLDRLSPAARPAARVRLPAVRPRRPRDAVRATSATARRRAVFNAYLFNGLMAAAASLAGAFFVHRARDRAGDAGRRGSRRAAADRAGDALAACRPRRIEIDAFVAGAARARRRGSSPSARIAAAVRCCSRRRLRLARHRLAGAWRTRRCSSLAALARRRDARRSVRTAAAGGPGRSPSPCMRSCCAWPRRAGPSRSCTRCMRSASLTLGAARRAARPRDHRAVGRRRERLALARLAGRAGGAAAAAAAAGDGARLAGARCCPRPIVDSAGAVLAAGLWLWTLVANVASDGSAAPLPYLPLLNPLDLGIGIALVAILLWLRSGRPRRAAASLGAGRRRPASSGSTRSWCAASITTPACPYHFDAWLGSLAVQTGITLLWTATALVTMWLAATRAARVPWMVGAALLAAVVLKLLARRPVRHRHGDPDRLVHRRRRADAGHRLRRAAAGQGGIACDDLKHSICVPSVCALRLRLRLGCG